MTYRDYLGTIAFFQGLDAPALAMIVQAAREQRVARDTMLFHQDEPATTFALFIEGQARLIQITPEGSQVILGFLGPGQGGAGADRGGGRGECQRSADLV